MWNVVAKDLLVCPVEWEEFQLAEKNSLSKHFLKVQPLSKLGHFLFDDENSWVSEIL